MVEWQESLCIGVLEVDIQHKLLFEKFNDFLKGCEETADSEPIQRLFWFLEAYAITHFAEEEKLMLHVGFPDYLNHKNEHAEFSGEIARLKERLQKEGPTAPLVAQIKLFISRWLVNHISRMDRPLAPYVKDAGNLPSADFPAAISSRDISASPLISRSTQGDPTGRACGGSPPRHPCNLPLQFPAF